MKDWWNRLIRRWMANGPDSLVVYLLPLGLFLLARTTLPNYYEFESAEDTYWSRIILEHGNIPLYGIGHIRFLAASLGPLIYYLKVIPYSLSPNPEWELAFMLLLHSAAVVFSVGLVRMWTVDLLEKGRDVWTNRVREVLGDNPERLARWVALGVGILYGLSLHNMLLCSHTHGMYYAAGLMPIFLFFVYRFVTRGGVTNIAAAAALFGVLSQTYQLTLFAPGMVVILLAVYRRWPTAREWKFALIAMAIPYIPYVLSEFYTGFSNTRGLFRFSRGQGDEVLVEGQYIANFRYALNAFVDYRFIPWGFELLFLAAGAVGILTGIRGAWRTAPLRFPLVFFGYYMVLPLIVLDAPRIQLTRPIVQWWIALGVLRLVVWIVDVSRSSKRWLRKATSVLALAVLVVSLTMAWWGHSALFHYFINYPSRVAALEPTADTPDLAEAREVLGVLHDEFDVGVDNLGSTVFSSFIATGFFGHHYLMRTIEEPGETSNHADPVLVVDRRFPYRIISKHERWLGETQIASLDPDRLPFDSFRMQLSCEHNWCAERSGEQPAHPYIRYFGGCDVFRKLDPRLSVCQRDCEELRKAPAHDRIYRGTMKLPERADGNKTYREILWVTTRWDCDLTVRVDGETLVPRNDQTSNLSFHFFDVTDLPRVTPMELTLEITGCRQEVLMTTQFTAELREPYADAP